MKSLEFGPGIPWKALTTWFLFAFCQVFPPFVKIYVKPVSIEPVWLSSHHNNPVSVNPAWLSTTNCQTIFIIKPVFYNPVWLWLHVARMIIRYSSQPGMTYYIHQHCMVGVINAQDLGSHPYYNQVGKPTVWCNITGMIYFIFWYFLQPWLSTRLCIGHYDLSGAKPPGQFFYADIRIAWNYQGI